MQGENEENEAHVMKFVVWSEFPRKQTVLTPLVAREECWNLLIWILRLILLE
jgi:hypothetical protein